MWERGRKGDAGGGRIPIEGAGGVIEIGGDVAVGEHDSLGLTGGPGGVDESGQILWFDLGATQPLLHIDGRSRGALEERRESGGWVFQVGYVIHHDDVLELCLASDGLDSAVLGFRGHNGYAGAGVVEQSGDLVRGQGGINGDVRGAKDQGGEVDDWPLPSILRKDCDAVAFENAPGAEGVGEGVDAGDEIVARYGEPVTVGVLPEDSSLTLAGEYQSDHVD